MAKWAWGQNFVNAILGTLNGGPISTDNPLPVTPVGSGGGTQEVQGNVASGDADTGNPVKTGGTYNAAAPTFTDGDRADTQSDVNGNTKTTLGTLISGESQTLNRMLVAQSFQMGTAAAAATTVIKSGPGVLKRVIFPTLVAGGTCKIYDNTAGSGTVLLDTVTIPGTVTALAPFAIELDLAFTTGCTVVMTGTAFVGDIVFM